MNVGEIIDEVRRKREVRRDEQTDCFRSLVDLWPREESCFRSTDKSLLDDVRRESLRLQTRALKLFAISLYPVRRGL